MKTLSEYIQEDEIIFMGSNWIESENAPSDSPVKGHIYAGEKPCVNCNDLFYWGCADSEDISEETFGEFIKAINECGGNEAIGADLYCCRRRKMRPQGACYSYIPKEYWELFNACGDARDVDFLNPYEIGKYGGNGEKC